MLVTTINLFRMVWPFLREVVFGRDSVKEWIKKNGITLVWMLLVIVMLAIVLKLVVLLSHATKDINDLTTKETDLSQQLKAEKSVEEGLRAQLDKLKSHGSVDRGTVGVNASSYPPPPQPKLSRKDQELYDQLRQLKHNDEEN